MPNIVAWLVDLLFGYVSLAVAIGLWKPLFVRVHHVTPNVFSLLTPVCSLVGPPILFPSVFRPSRLRSLWFFYHSAQTFALVIAAISRLLLVLLCCQIRWNHRWVLPPVWFTASASIPITTRGEQDKLWSFFMCWLTLTSLFERWFVGNYSGISDFLAWAFVS